MALPQITVRPVPQTDSTQRERMLTLLALALERSLVDYSGDVRMYPVVPGIDDEVAR